MIRLLKRLYFGSRLGKVLLYVPRKLYHVFLFHVVSDKKFINLQYRRAFGELPDLRHPKTMNEKIQWLKLYDRTPLHTQCVDKYAVRDYIAEKVGEKYLIPLLFSTEDPADITPERLPDAPFVIKTTHGSANNTFVTDKSLIDWGSLRKGLRQTMRQNYYPLGREWPYKNAKPRIVVERMLQNEDGTIPFDYKIHCFHGSPKVIQVDIDRFGDHRRNLYDTQWQLQPFTWAAWRDGKCLEPNGRHISMPCGLKEMLETAAKLSSPFLYARVDLYEVRARVYFGEITFHHGSGTQLICPSEWDRKVGDWLTLPTEMQG